MAAEVAYSSTNGADDLRGQLFNGFKFWLSAKVPLRSRFINDIKVPQSLGEFSVFLE